MARRLGILIIFLVVAHANTRVKRVKKSYSPSSTCIEVHDPTRQSFVYCQGEGPAPPLTHQTAPYELQPQLYPPVHENYGFLQYMKPNFNIGNHGLPVPSLVSNYNLGVRPNVWPYGGQYQATPIVQTSPLKTVGSDYMSQTSKTGSELTGKWRAETSQQQNIDFSIPTGQWNQQIQGNLNVVDLRKTPHQESLSWSDNSRSMNQRTNFEYPNKYYHDTSYYTPRPEPTYKTIVSFPNVLPTLPTFMKHSHKSKGHTHSHDMNTNGADFGTIAPQTQTYGIGRRESLIEDHESDAHIHQSQVTQIPSSIQ